MLVERVHAICLCGGSAFGLAAADGVMRFLREREVGFQVGPARVPIVPAAVVFDLAVGTPLTPGPDEGYAACLDALEPGMASGRVGAGTGCTVGKLLGHEACTKGGLGLARVDVAGAAVAAIAAANSFGEVVGEDGAIMAGAWRDGRYAATLELLRDGHRPPFPRESTTLACVLTDARLDKTQAWLVARAANSGVAIRDAVSQATGAPGVPAARERERTTAQRSPARPR
jgi:L-aminopeptidase/D-esterase-like protein